MAKGGELPGFLEKRKILFGRKTSAEKMRATGLRFMEAERYDDALEFFARCSADDLVRRIADVAMERADTPLFMRAKRVLKEPVSGKEWDRLADNALKAGTASKAHVAKLQAGKKEEADELKQQTLGTAMREESETVSQEEPQPDSGRNGPAIG